MLDNVRITAISAVPQNVVVEIGSEEKANMIDARRTYLHMIVSQLTTYR
jgi:hypothetical protein